MQRIVVFLALALVAVTLGGAAPAHAIANGDTVPDGTYGFAVKLTDYDIPVLGGGTRDSSCSGGLISPHWVLTAGHCFRDTRGNRVSRPVARKTVATVGRASLSGSGGHDVRVVEVRQQGTLDIALARMDKAVTDVKPLRLSRSAPKSGARVRLAGFGLLRATDAKTPNRLRTGLFKVTSVSKTEIGMTGIDPAGNTSPCEHDSGGPYFTVAKDGTATVVGVVSHGPDCPHTGPDQAGRIDKVAAWIQSVIRDDVLPSPTPSRTRAGTSPPAAAAPPDSSNSLVGFAIPWAYLGAGLAGVLFCIGLLQSARGSRRRASARRKPPHRRRH
ncbi:S1 family peptidase [Actinoplanes awajinensis]|uniref:S1 family peptidase n=1 Tax=Actinoplanes awajinensis TaxID=135946 RepID=UPI00082C92DF|nr:trypsin-like serine protease [Actinoplanes awajinensis]